MAKEDKKVTIHIDRNEYHLNQNEITGKQLKELAGLGEEYDLFKVEPGQAEDLEVKDEDKISIKSGDKFISAPKELNPGR